MAGLSAGAPRLLGVVQARMGSSRLPGKVLRTLAGRSVLERVVRAARLSGTLDEIVVATTTEPADDAIVAESVRLGVAVHRGPTEDVLARFVGALRAHPADAVVRFTADCPLLDPEVIALVVRCFVAAGNNGARRSRLDHGARRSRPDVDYVSTGVVRCLPRGLDVEVVTAGALRRADLLATGYHRSHVTSYIGSNPDAFRVVGITLAPDRSDLRLTLDTPEDWSLIDAVVSHLGDDPPSLPKIVGLLDSRPDLVALNAAVTQKPLEAG